MTLQSSWWSGNLLLLWQHSGGPHTSFCHMLFLSLQHLGGESRHSVGTPRCSARSFFQEFAEQLDMTLHFLSVSGQAFSFVVHTKVTCPFKSGWRSYQECQPPPEEITTSYSSLPLCSQPPCLRAFSSIAFPPALLPARRLTSRKACSRWTGQNKTKQKTSA